MKDPGTLIPLIRSELALVDPDGPLYRRLGVALSHVFSSECVGSGHTLPSERKLSEALGISRVTVRRALDEMAREGRVRRRQGAQTRIVDRVQKALSQITGFSEELAARGSRPGHRWVSRQTVLPTPTEAMALNLSTQDPVVRLVRIRTADDEPLAIERATIPQSILPDGAMVEASLYAVLRLLGAEPVRGAQRIRAGIMAPVEAELLRAEVGSPLLIIERRCYLADGRPVEFTETRYNGALYDFLTDLGD